MFRKTLLTAAATMLTASMALAGGMKKDIVDTAVEAGDFSTLVAAVQAAGLVETLKGDGPFTVFAPTDEAFAALPDGTVENLLKPENREQLTQILTYHVVPGRVGADDISTGEVDTVAGIDLTIIAPDSDAGHSVVKVNDATVINADIDTSNGIIHVIDKVLLPQS